MGKKYPTPLERALGGDADALLAVLGTVIGPVFDVALHREHHQGSDAVEQAAIGALRELRRELESGALSHPEPLAVAVRALLTDPTTPVAPTEEDHPLAGLAADERDLVLAALVADLERDALGYALGSDSAGAARRLNELLARRVETGEEWRVRLDAVASASSLPPELDLRAME